MRSILMSAAAIAMLALTSCQKEIDDENGNGGNTTVQAGTRLLKTVTISGADSTQTNFTYNGAGKITYYAASGISGGQPVDLRISLVRNTAGIIQKQITKSVDLLAFGIDSIVSNVNYDAASSRYKNAITMISIFGFTLMDSIAFNYDAGGKLLSQIDYLDDGSGMGYEPITKSEFTYAGNNLLTQKVYSYDTNSSAFVLEETYTFEYDAKINPLQFAAEAPIMGMSQFYSASNVSKTTMVSATTPADNFVSNVTYTYNTANRPLTGIETDGTSTATTTYTYQ